MSTFEIFEIVFMWIMILLRVLTMITAVFLPFITLVCLIISIVERQRSKYVLLRLFGLIMSVVLVFLVFFGVEVPARIDKKSIKEHKSEISSLEPGNYEFDTGYIEGGLAVYNKEDYKEREESEIYKELETYKKYRIDDETTCIISPVFCGKDERFSHIFEPTIAGGILVIRDSKKIVEVSYYYNDYNLFTCLWFITNPEVFYRPKIDFGDILNSCTETDDYVIWW